MFRSQINYSFLKYLEVWMSSTKQKKIHDLSFLPLAARMRPLSLEEFAGQRHLIGSDKPLRRAISQGILHSMILWGPPGTGKTTLANLIAQQSGAFFQSLSAVFSGVKDIRIIVNEAKI